MRGGIVCDEDMRVLKIIAGMCRNHSSGECSHGSRCGYAHESYEEFSLEGCPELLVYPVVPIMFSTISPVMTIDDPQLGRRIEYIHTRGNAEQHKLDTETRDMLIKRSRHGDYEDGPGSRLKSYSDNPSDFTARHNTAFPVSGKMLDLVRAGAPTFPPIYAAKVTTAAKR